MDDDPANREELSEILPRLIPPLRARAQELFRGRGCGDGEAVLAGTGMSAKDLVSNTILTLLKDDLWKSVERSEEMLPFALKIMKRDFLDLVKSPKYKSTAQEPVDIHNIHSSENDFEAAEAASLFNWLVRVLRPDDRMRAYLEAWLLRGANTRADIAHEMGISVREVTNIRERLIPKYKVILHAFSNGALAKNKRG